MIRSAKYEDLMNISILHTKCFPDSKLGLDMSLRYYEEFLMADDVFLVDEEGININGFVMGTSSLGVRQNNFVRNNSIRLVTRILQLCIKFDKDTWIRIWKSGSSFIKQRLLTFVGKDNINEVSGKTYLNLVSICVSDDCRGTGIGRKLVKEFEKQLIILGYQGYKLSVRKANSRAIQFYRKLNMSVYKETESRYEFRKKIVGTTIGSKE